jgi:hypothetical protein
MSKALLTTVAATVTIAAGLAIFTASPAQADAGACVAYLEGKGYGPNARTEASCAVAASGEIGGWLQCRQSLTGSGVPTSVAARACDIGGQ